MSGEGPGSLLRMRLMARAGGSAYLPAAGDCASMRFQKAEGLNGLASKRNAPLRVALAFTTETSVVIVQARQQAYGVGDYRSEVSHENGARYVIMTGTAVLFERLLLERTSRQLLLASGIALFSVGLHAQEVKPDLTRYHTLGVQVSAASEVKIDPDRVASTGIRVSNPLGYLTGLIVGYLRASDHFTRVVEARPGVASDAILEVEVTGLRIVGKGGRFAGGALAGKDAVEADVRLVDSKTHSVVAEASVDEQGTRGFIWNVSGANIHAAMGGFAKSLVEWLGEPSDGFGKPRGWAGKLERGQTLAVECTGAEGSRLEAFKQTDQTICKALAEALGAAGVAVAGTSATVLSFHVEAAGLPVAGLSTESVLVGRWRITNAGAVEHDDLAVSTFASDEPSSGIKRTRENLAAVVGMQMHQGVGAFFPDTQ